MTDSIVRATAANAQIRAFACSVRECVEQARRYHNTSPVATAALGRLLGAGVMMGSMMKGDRDALTLQIHGDGPLEGILVSADSHGNVKGYVNNPGVILPANAVGKLDVGGAVGRGLLSVTRDLGMREPYVGQTALQTGEIAEDLTYYFAVSEQVPSSVGLGVLMNRDNTVRQAGGFIIQIMPFAEDAVIERLEQNLQGIPSVTGMLDEGKSPLQLLETVLEGFEPEVTDILPAAYRCDCGRQRVERALISIGRSELQEMIDEGKEIEVSCQFCDARYAFSVEELRALCERASQAQGQ